MKDIRALLPAVAFTVILCGCGDDHGLSSRPEITIRVMSKEGTPIDRAYITGGFDWTRFDATTDAGGYARLPAFSVDWDTDVRAPNHFPIVIRPRNGESFVMNRTPLKLQLIGHSDVYVVKFVEDTLIHLDYNGDLVTFLYSETGMAEVARVGLARLRRQAVLRGDTLWYTTHSDGVYSYDVSVPADPQLLSHLAIEGYLGPIAVSDSLVVVSKPFGQGGVEIYVVRPDGSWSLAGAWNGPYVESLEIEDNVLIVYSRGGKAISFLSLADPADVREIYSWGNPYYGRPRYHRNAFRFGDSIVFVPAVELYHEHFVHVVLDISDAMTPVWQPSFSSQARLDGLLNDTLAIGFYDEQPALLTNVQGRGFRVVALALSTDDLQWLPDIDQSLSTSAPLLEKPAVLGVTNPPQMVGDFVLLDARLWRIVRE